MMLEEKNERVLAAIDSEPWLITESGLMKIREIAARENLIITADDLAKIEERREALAAKKAARLDGTYSVAKRDSVAIIDVNGPIFRYADLFSSISGGATLESLAMDFNAAMDDRSVEAVLLNIDSPGGQAKGINEFANMISARRGEKPIGGYIGGDGGSAAYWIAAAVEPGLLGIDATAFAGSIGAVIGVRKEKASEKDRTVSFEFVSKQSPNKRLDPETEAGRSDLQRRADSMGGAFVDGVARLRGVESDRVLSDFGGGRMLMGQEAKDAGLVDQVTSMEAMIQTLKARRREMNMGPRVAEPKLKGGSMKYSIEVKAQLGLAETATDAEVEAKFAEMKTAQTKLEAAEKAKVAAEAEARTTKRNAQVDAWEKEGKISGNATKATRDFYVVLSDEQAKGFEGVMAALPKFDMARAGADAQPQLPAPTAAAVTADDIATMATNAKSGQKVNTALSARQKENPKFSLSDLKREVLGK